MPVLQHVPIEHPGNFRDFFVADGISWDTGELDSGGSVPSLDGYDSLWVMCGPMDVWERSNIPGWWLSSGRFGMRFTAACPLWGGTKIAPGSAEWVVVRRGRYEFQSEGDQPVIYWERQFDGTVRFTGLEFDPSHR